MFLHVLHVFACLGEGPLELQKCRPILGYFLNMYVPSISRSHDHKTIISQESSVVSKSPGLYVHLNNYWKLLQWRYCKVIVKPSTQRILNQRKQSRLISCGQGMQRNRRTKQLSLGDGEVEELKLVERDGAL